MQKITMASLAALTMLWGANAMAANPEITRDTLPKDYKGEFVDKDFRWLLGDTAIPAGRKEAEFYGELAGQAEVSETTSVRNAHYKQQQAAATTKSLEGNAAWLKANPNPQPGKAVYSNIKVKLGNETLFESPELMARLKGKRVGLITNPSGCDSQFVSTIDKLNSNPDIELVALFAPEHGVRGAERAGDKVEDLKDELTGIPVYSLHGEDADKIKKNKPRPSQMKDIDVLMYDIQDTGNRSYTYPYTMRMGMQAAYESGVEFWVLDRPNPLGGDLVSGNVADPHFISPVGWAPVAYVYGMTAGETAKWFIGEMNMKTDLTVVPMKGWTRDMQWTDTGLPWIPTSTHNQSPDNAWYMAITGEIGELLAISVGVGYPSPFQYVGAPWIDSIRLAQELNKRELPGIYFKPAYFRPYYNTYKEEMCGGIQCIITDYRTVMPVEASLHIMEAINTMYPEQKLFSSGADADVKKAQGRISMFNKVLGGPRARALLLEGKTAQEVIDDWSPRREAFKKDRAKYLLY